jgi:hypothetical protein
MTFKQNNLVGLILIAIGAMALLGNIGILGDMPTTIFALGMGAAGVYLIRAFFKNHKQIWTSIVGFTFLGLALASITGAMSGFYFLGMIGLGFAMIYRLEHKQWWAVIPGGVLLTLALMAGSEVIFPRWDAGPLFFLGLAATFGYLYVNARKKWAVYPALALLVVALLGVTFTGGWILPILLIGAGLYALNRKSQASFQSNTTSAPVDPVAVVPANVPAVPGTNIAEKNVTEITIHEIKPQSLVTIEVPNTKETIAELEDLIEASSDMTSEGGTQAKPNPEDEAKA